MWLAGRPIQRTAGSTGSRLLITIGSLEILRKPLTQFARAIGVELSTHGIDYRKLRK
jgi:hypothetical protein